MPACFYLGNQTAQRAANSLPKNDGAINCYLSFMDLVAKEHGSSTEDPTSNYALRTAVSKLKLPDYLLITVWRLYIKRFDA